MFTERLHVLIDPERRRRLEEEARQRGTSVGAVIREAVDAHLGLISPERRTQAWAELKAMRGGKHLSVEEIEQAVAEEREQNFPIPRRRR